MPNNSAFSSAAEYTGAAVSTPFELGFTWIILAALTALFLSSLANSLRTSVRRDLTYRFSTTIQLPIINDQISEAAERRILNRSRAMMAGGLAGVLTAAAVVYLNPNAASASLIWLVTLPLILIGMSAGAAIVALRASLFSKNTEVVRVARPVTVTLSDYLSPARLRMPAMLLLAAGVLTLAAFALGLSHLIDTETFLRSAALPMLAIAIITLLSGRALARRLLKQPQPASSELELAWDDAFRAETLRGLWMFGAILAWLAIAASGLGMLQGLDALHGTTWSLGLGSQLFIWGYLAILLTFSIGQAQRHFRFALWPDLVVEKPESADAP